MAKKARAKANADATVFESKTKGPKFARCNQCRLIFKKKVICAEHAARMGHAYEPCLWCTVCSMTFMERQERQAHIKVTGHVQTAPTTYAEVPSSSVAVGLRVGVASTSTAANGAAHDSEASDDEPMAPATGNSLAGHANITISGSAQASAVPKMQISPNPVRCNQCKLVCKNVGVLQKHAQETGHVHKPMYFCTVCLIQLGTLKSTKEHARSTGHYPESTSTSAAYPGGPGGVNVSAALPFHPPTTPLASASQHHLRPPSAGPSTQGAGLAEPRSSGSSGAVSEASKVGSVQFGLGQYHPFHPVLAPPGPKENQCVKCNLAFASAEELQTHYDVSPLHPTCRDCGLGFASIGPWATHRARCPPPGSTAVASRASNDQGTTEDTAQAKHTLPEQRVESTPESTSSPAAAAAVDSSDASRLEDRTTADSSTGISTELSDVSSITPTTPAVPDTRKPQRVRVPSPTPSAAVSTTATTSTSTSTSNVPSSFYTAPSQGSSLVQAAEKAHNVLQGEQHRPDTPPQSEVREQPRGLPNKNPDSETRPRAHEAMRDPPVSVDSALLYIMWKALILAR
ncbi:hypothetical protein L226DRAFT_385371 [Lentinus tigrinus ALCF2SS1-7]|uniref:C2H2-type domain-containing protein n=1 Tax=Lentinus tigrinus ALCF2SS1-6 TaxID=1328759 RepID=A0A5C2SL79_9APHY|nr:hypothetical protein L227DRAFT_331523 [Lentinus tigrinus ALCF2SS1-6]RPD67957.1 hypothetical protein L226DRAFT_385371 [Lentinus tigrinus ALCF2SS1-7]